MLCASPDRAITCDDQGGDRFLLDYYKQFSDLIIVEPLTVSAASLEIASRFLNSITSGRRHEHYT